MKLSQDEIIQMAEKARIGGSIDGLISFFDTAYAAGAAAEREACEVAVSKVKMPYEKCASSAHAADCTIVEAIRAIRARGNGD